MQTLSLNSHWSNLDILIRPNFLKRNTPNFYVKYIYPSLAPYSIQASEIKVHLGAGVKKFEKLYYAIGGFPIEIETKISFAIYEISLLICVSISIGNPPYGEQVRVRDRVFQKVCI